MKSLFNFLTEAQTAASQQAARLGLKGDGHGGWYDGQGEFVAKTEGGKLKFYNKRQVVGQRDPAQTEKEKNIPSPSYNDPEAQQSQQAAAATTAQTSGEEEQEGPPPNKKDRGTLTLAFGRFNPPTIGHQQLMDVAANAASEDEDGEYLIFPSRSEDKKKNPLDPDTKIDFMQTIYPNHANNIVNDKNIKTIFDALRLANDEGFSNVRIVGGSDRVKEFEKLAGKYNGKNYDFDNIEVISAGERDADAKGVEGMSASRMRLAAAEGDFKKFKEGLPSELNNKEAKRLYNTVRIKMNIEEEWNIWEIAPKLDFKNLRENYLIESIFKVGDIVENLNTGMVGEIIRRGTNYLICVTESGEMFKSWISDLREYSEKRGKNVDSEYRLPGKPNTLVGTPGYFKYAARQTPGNINGVTTKNLQDGGKPYVGYGMNFINRYRVKKSKT